MILRRLGNKNNIAKEIQKHFPPHKIYVEPFFGAGGMFFNKIRANNNLLNDIDSEVFNLWIVVNEKSNELNDFMCNTPYHQDIVNYWNENKETDSIKKAARFLYLTNYVFMGKGTTLKLNAAKNEFNLRLTEKLTFCNKMLIDCQFSNLDFRKFIKSINFIQDGRQDEKQTLIYADPPYLETGNNYSQSFTENDVIDLFDCLQNTGAMFAYSEFDHPFILSQADERKLNVITIGERHNMKNRRTEILVTNYKKPLSLFDGV